MDRMLIGKQISIPRNRRLQVARGGVSRWRVLAMLTSLVLIGAGLYAHWPHDYLSAGSRADRVVVQKSERRMTLYHNGHILRQYTVAIGRNAVGRKEREGDRRTPEGRYLLDSRHANNSHFHRSIHVSYPNSEDRVRAQRLGVETGGAISIHGLRNDLWFFGRLHRWFDWTKGCIAVTNQEMDEIWQVVVDNTPIEIFP